MRILIVCQYYYPENFQINSIAESLVAEGYDITVLTGLPNYPTGIVPEEYKNGHRDEYINGVHVIRVYEKSRGKGVLHLGMNYLSFCLSALMKINTLKEEFDLVFVYQLSPVLMGLPAALYAKKRHLPLFLYCCDLWPESIKIYLKSEDNPAFYLCKKLSSYIYNSCQRIACQSSSFIPYMKETHNIPEERLIYLPAFADETYLDADFTPENDVTDFVFLGNLGQAQNLNVVLEAIDLIKDTPLVKFHFVGDGSALAEMKSFVKEHGLESVVSFYGRRPVEEMPSFYKLADACLVSLKADNKTGLTLPSKVQGYMAAGKPIIGMIDGSASEVIKESNCGICVPAGDVQGLANAMRDFATNKETYQACGENSRAYFRKNFRQTIFLDRLMVELERLANK